MTRRTLLVSVAVLFLTLPLAAWATDYGTFNAKVNEIGQDDNPIGVPGVKVEVFGGYGFKALFSSSVTGADGGCALNRVPLGTDVLVKLTKAGYVTQYAVGSYSDAEQDAVFWIGSDDKINDMYKSLGETFDQKKGQVFLDISGEDGEGIAGVQLTVTSGKVIDIDNGQYLILNAAGTSLKVGIQKPGYAFDIESVIVPLFPGTFTQYDVNVQSDAGISGSVMAEPTSGPITGKIVLASNASIPVSGVSVAFTSKSVKSKNFNSATDTVRPSVLTKSDGTYRQDGFLFKKPVFVTPGFQSTRFKSFIPAQRKVTVKKATGVSNVNFKAKP